MFLIAASKKDIAGINIARQIIDLYGFDEDSESSKQNPLYSKNLQGREIKLVFLNEETIFTHNLSDHFSPQLLVFISRHSGVAGIPTLSVHTPGNLTDKTEFGGLPRRVSVSPASAMKNALLEMDHLRAEMALNYEVSYECTHHGPSLEVPTMFAELGSPMEQWKDLKAAQAVANSVMSAVLNKSKYPAVLGVGGPHYNAKFTKIALATQSAFGHIIPKHAVPQVDGEIIRQCIQRTLEKVDRTIFDWKGMKRQDRERLAAELCELEIQVEKV